MCLVGQCILSHLCRKDFETLTVWNTNNCTLNTLAIIACAGSYSNDGLAPAPAGRAAGYCERKHEKREKHGEEREAGNFRKFSKKKETLLVPANRTPLALRNPLYTASSNPTPAMRNAGTAWLVFAILLGGDEGRLNSASSSVFGSDRFVASAGVGHKKESSFQPFGKASVSAVRFTEIAAGQHSWSSRFRCAETTWFSYWAAQEYAPCNSTTGPSSITQAAAGGQFSCYLHGGNPIDDTTKSPWFCTGRNVQVNYKAIDFNSIRYNNYNCMFEKWCFKRPFA